MRSNKRSYIIETEGGSTYLRSRVFIKSRLPGIQGGEEDQDEWGDKGEEEGYYGGAEGGERHPETAVPVGTIGQERQRALRSQGAGESSPNQGAGARSANAAVTRPGAEVAVGGSSGAGRLASGQGDTRGAGANSGDQGGPQGVPRRSYRDVVTSAAKGPSAGPVTRSRTRLLQGGLSQS